MSDTPQAAVQETEKPAEAEVAAAPKRRKRSSKGRRKKAAAGGEAAAEGEAAPEEAADSAEVAEDDGGPGTPEDPEGGPEGASGDAAHDVDEASGERSGDAAEEPGGELEDDGPTEEELVRQVSALLFASPDPLGPGRIAKVLGTTQARVKAAFGLIESRLAEAGLGFELRGLAGGSTFMTPPSLGDTVAGLSKHAAVERISPAALETLAVVAYRQPVTKAEIEAIRGVQAGPVLRSLVDRGLVRVVGRSDEPGHALQYGTTKEFLTRFGLESLDDLPRDGELARD